MQFFKDYFFSVCSLATLGALIYIAKKWKRSNGYIELSQKDQEKIRQLINTEYYFLNKLQRKLPQDYLKNFSPIGVQDKDRVKFTKIFQSLKENNYDPSLLDLDHKQSRAIGCFLGMAICDALGASTEFKSYKRQGHGIIKEGFSDINKAISEGKLGSRHGKVGIWTDDASMGIAMGYGLMFSQYEFDPILTRQMFHLWWNHGLGNGGRDRSIGLGGNIYISMSEFQRNPNQPYTSKGQQNNNGNGSLMRLAPIPVAYHKNVIKAGQVATKQSLTTHNGLEAKECARLMTEIIVNLINRKLGEDWKQNLQKTCQYFKSQIKSVMCLAKSQQETQQMWKQSSQKDPSFERFNKTLMDRNWNWKDKDFEYSPSRLRGNSGYIGSYCMDGLSMALHIVYHTESFKQSAIRNADIGGDCDTVGSIAGQIAGAIYGIDKEMLKLYSQMPDFIEKRYQAFLCGYKLYHNKSIQLKSINQPGNNESKQKDLFFKCQQVFDFDNKQN